MTGYILLFILGLAIGISERINQVREGFVAWQCHHEHLYLKWRVVFDSINMLIASLKYLGIKGLYLLSIALLLTMLLLVFSASHAHLITKWLFPWWLLFLSFFIGWVFSCFQVLIWEKTIEVAKKTSFLIHEASDTNQLAQHLHACNKFDRMLVSLFWRNNLIYLQALEKARLYEKCRHLPTAHQPVKRKKL